MAEIEAGLVGDARQETRRTGFVLRSDRTDALRHGLRPGRDRPVGQKRFPPEVRHPRRTSRTISRRLDHLIDRTGLPKSAAVSGTSSARVHAACYCAPVTVDLGIDGLGPGTIVGGGGSSTVFSATRTSFGDRVAVKVLRGTIVGDVAKRQFNREVAALTELADCEGIIAALDSGVTNRGEPYLILPLFEHSAQSEIDQGGPVHWPRAAEIISKAAAALHLGHERSVLHRDLKPSNLLLTSSDDVFVADFGISKLSAVEATSATVHGYTIAFAAPEVLRGEPASIKSDLYSLARTCVALLNGEVHGRTDSSPLAVATRAMHGETPTINAEIPARLRELLHQTLDIDPHARPASADEFRVKLLRASKPDHEQSAPGNLPPEPSVTPVASPPENHRGNTTIVQPRSLAAEEISDPVPDRKKSRRALIGGITAAVLVAAGAGGFWISRGSPDPEPGVSETAVSVSSLVEPTPIAEDPPTTIDPTAAPTSTPIPATPAPPVPDALQINPVGEDFDRIYRELDGAREYLKRERSLDIAEIAGPKGGLESVEQLIEFDAQFKTSDDYEYTIDQVELHGWVNADKVQLLVTDTVVGGTAFALQGTEPEFISRGNKPTVTFLVELEREETQRWRIMSDIAIPLVEDTADSGSIVYVSTLLPEIGASEPVSAGTIEQLNGAAVPWEAFTFRDPETDTQCVEIRSDKFRLPACVAPHVADSYPAESAVNHVMLQHIDAAVGFVLSASPDARATFTLANGTTSVATIGSVASGEVAISAVPMPESPQSVEIVVGTQSLGVFDITNG